MREYPWFVVAVTCISAFTGQLDASIVQLTLPDLEQYFHSTLAATSWVAIGYLLAYAATLPLFARLSELYGRKSLYLLGYVVFSVSSLLCGFASSLSALIAFRLLQGVGGGLLGANSLTILATTAGPSRRGRAMGLFAAAQAVGISAGPVFGGLLLGSVGWRWVFWISVPFGLAGVVLGWLVVGQTPGPVTKKKLDRWGAMLLSPALAALIVALSELGTWQPGTVLLTMFFSAILLPPFIWRERLQEDPLIDLRLFRVAPFVGGIIGVSASYALLYAMFFVESFVFVRGLGLSPFAAGLHLASVPIAIGITAPVSGRLYERFGSTVLTTSGMGFCSFAIILLAYAPNVRAFSLYQLIALMLFGVGLGLYIAPNNAATMAAAPDGRSAEAGGLLNLMRVLGCMCGIVVASSALSWRLHHNTGFAKRTSDVSNSVTLAAAHDVLWTLLLFSILASLAALLKNRKRNQSPSEAELLKA